MHFFCNQRTIKPKILKKIRKSWKLVVGNVYNLRLIEFTL